MDEVIRLRTINELTSMLHKMVDEYRQHIENGGEHRTYADAIQEVSDRMLMMVEPDAERREQLLRMARAM